MTGPENKPGTLWALSLRVIGGDIRCWAGAASLSLLMRHDLPFRVTEVGANNKGRYVWIDTSQV